MAPRSSIEIRVLGNLEVYRDGQLLDLPRSRKTRALLAYLALAGGRHRRERLCELLWDVPDDPRGALRWSLTKLRPLLDDTEARRIVADRETVGFDLTGVTIDAHQVRALARKASDHVSKPDLARAAAAFRGDFLEGLDLSRCFEFEAWRVAERHELRAIHARILIDLIGCYADSPEKALRHARELVRLDPSDEQAHITLVRLLLVLGKRIEAEQQRTLSIATLQAANGDVGQFGSLLNQSVPAATELTDNRPPSDRNPSSSDQPMMSYMPPSRPPEDPTADDGLAIGTGERKHLTVLVAELETATPLAMDRDPESDMAQTDQLVRAMADAVRRHAGTVSQIQGGCIVALFGAPIAHEEHAVLACRAAHAVRNAVRSGSDGDARVGIGVHTGEVTIRAVEAGDSRQYDAVGPVLQLAERVKANISADTIGLTAETRHAAEGFIETKSLGAWKLTGFPEPVDVFELVACRTSQSRWEARRQRGLAPFVGRGAQLGILSSALDAVQQGEGRAVAIVGAAGVGKSRLAYEFLRSRLPADWQLLEAGTTPHELAEPLQPIRVLVRTLFGLDDNTDPDTAILQIRRRLEAVDPSLFAASTPIQSLLGLPVTDPRWSRLDPPRAHRLTVAAVKALLVEVSRRRPLAVLVEDVHWIDDQSRTVLNEIVATLPSAPILLIVTHRLGWLHVWSAKSSFSECRIDPLLADAGRDLLDALMGPDGSLAEFKHRLLSDCGGNPFFLEETIRSLVEQGILGGTPGARTLFGNPNQARLPHSIRDVLAARTDRLSAESKQLLKAVAVAGEEISRPLLRAALSLPDGTLDQQLAELQDAEYLIESQVFPEPVYRFKHALTRQSVYEGILHEDRCELHCRIGSALEQTFDGRVDDIVAILAHHFEAGEDWDAAARYLLKAALRGKSGYAYATAADLAHRAWVAAREAGMDAAFRSEALVLQGDLLSLLGDIDGANGAYDAAADMANDAGDRQQIARRRHRVGSVTRAGGKIVYYEHGAGAETLVFVHPLLYGLATFQPVIERLCGTYRIITFDGRGTGASDPMPKSYDANEQTKDAIAVIKRVSPEKPVVCVGLSRGALLATKMALTAPKVIQKLVLISGGVRQTVGSDAPQGNDVPMDSVVVRMNKAIALGDLTPALELFASTVYSDPGTEDLGEAFVDQCLRLPRTTLMNFLTYDPAFDVSGALPNLRVPTLVMHGEADLDTPLDLGRTVAGAIPNAEFYVFEGAGHLPTFTATPEFCDVLEIFVQTGTIEVAQPTGVS